MKASALATYRRKLRAARQAAALVRSRDTVAFPIATGQPATLLHALGERDDWQKLELFGGLLIDAYPVLRHPGVRLISGFFGPLERALVAEGARIEYLPADFIGWARYARRLRPRVVACALAPMDGDGYLSLGLHSGALFEAFLSAARDPDRLAVGEVVADMPRVLGLGRFGGHRIHVSEIDCLLESDRGVFELAPEKVTDADRAIAEHVEALVPDGATLQFGIGGVPNLVAGLLARSHKGDFGIHTEMFVDGIRELHEAGKVTNQKGIFDGFSIATFAAGTRELYRWMDGNPEIRMLPVEQVNNPAVIGQNRRMVSINSAIALDLSGQVMADTIGPRQYSGVGGHELFVMGAANSLGGKSILCLHSTAVVDGRRVSRIAAELPRGTRVTTPRHHVQYVVTEYGVADLGMATHRERARALAEIAHPDFRDELRDAARRLV